MFAACVCMKVIDEIICEAVCYCRAVRGNVDRVKQKGHNMKRFLFRNVLYGPSSRIRQHYVSASSRGFVLNHIVTLGQQAQ